MPNAHPDLQMLFRYVDDHQHAFLDRLLNYVRRPSISAYGEGMDEVAHFLLSQLRDLGLSAEFVPTPGWPMVLGRSSHVEGLPTVLLYGHYDVQPPDPLEAWISPPFEPTVRDGRVYARGIADNKGQHFAHLLALETLRAVHGSWPCNVIVLLEGEEEIGSPHMAEFVRAQRAQLAADLVITADGPVDPSGRSRLVFGVRGVLSFELRAHGAAQDVHSGNWGGVVPNPLWTIVQLLATMKNARGEITIDGFYDRVVPPTDQERMILSQLPVDAEAIKQTLGFSTFDQPTERGFFERLMFWPTLTINGLHGGYSGPGSKTVLPHEAVAKCDIRLVEAQTTADIMAKVKAHVHRYAPNVEVIEQGGMEPSKTPLDSPFAEPIRQAILHAQGAEPLLVPALGGSLPDYVFTKILGVPALLVPYGNPDQANHAPNENMEVARFFMGIKTSIAMLTHVGAMQQW